RRWTPPLFHPVTRHRISWPTLLRGAVWRRPRRSARPSLGHFGQVGWYLCRAALKLPFQRLEVDTLAVCADRLSRFRQISRSRGTLPLGRDVLPRRACAWAAQGCALAVGGAALFHRPARQPLCALPYGYRYPSRRQDREEVLPRPRLFRNRRERRDRR